MINKKLQQKLDSIRSHRVFDITVISVIIIAAITVGLKTHSMPEWLFQFITIFDIVITIFFVLEVSIRMACEDKIRNFFKNGWNIFDFTIVIISLIPVADSEMALVGRLLRIFRVLRLISFIPELRKLVEILIKTIPKMGYVIVLVFIIFYIYAVIGSILFHDINPTLWGDASISMLTLFRVATFEDWTDVMYQTMAVYPLSWIYYLSFIFIAVFTLLNMMIGVILDVFLNENRECDTLQKSADSVDARLNKIEQTLNEINYRLTKK